jgi:hypothetical protein
MAQMILSPHVDTLLAKVQYQGNSNDCGAYTCATVLNAILGLEIIGDNLANEMEKPVWRGPIYLVRKIPNSATLPWGMEDVFQSHGLKARWRFFAKEAYLKETLPLMNKILMPIIGSWNPTWAHVMTLVAWDEDKGWGFANTQYQHHNTHWVVSETFSHQWNRMGNLVVEVTIG